MATLREDHPHLQLNPLEAKIIGVFRDHNPAPVLLTPLEVAYILQDSGLGVLRQIGFLRRRQILELVDAETGQYALPEKAMQHLRYEMIRDHFEANPSISWGKQEILDALPRWLQPHRNYGMILISGLVNQLVVDGLVVKCGPGQCYYRWAHGPLASMLEAIKGGDELARSVAVDYLQETEDLSLTHAQGRLEHIL